jgi:lipoprotein-anchoring transpeptidase ErfK/SrfK
VENQVRLRGEAWLIIGLSVAVAGCDDFKSKPSPPPSAAAPAARAQTADTGYVAPYGSGSPPTPPPAAQPPVLNPPPMPANGSSAPLAKAIDSADFSATASAQERRDLLIRAQVILDRAHFSPGVIDGRAGDNFSRALAAFEAAHNVPATAGRASLDEAAWKALIAADGAPATQDYVIAPDDVKGPFLGVVPTDMVALSQLGRLGYATPVQALAEKFHMDQGLLRALNPKADFGVAGAVILVVKPGGDPLPPVERVLVDKSHDEVLAYGPGGKLVAHFPATVGSTERPAPTGVSSVKLVVFNPDYTYDPKRLTFGDRSAGVLTLRPGPNNPVGTTWIALAASTFGIHGSPDPSKVGKTASHGCVRLTNWDAASLGHAVKKGTQVVFVGTAA